MNSQMIKMKIKLQTIVLNNIKKYEQYWNKMNKNLIKSENKIKI